MPQLTDENARYFVLAMPGQGLQHWLLLNTANSLQGVQMAMEDAHNKGYKHIIAVQQSHHLKAETKVELTIITDGPTGKDEPLKLKRRDDGTLTLTKEPE
jgi:hypothetical protein